MMHLLASLNPWSVPCKSKWIMYTKLIMKNEPQLFIYGKEFLCSYECICVSKHQSFSPHKNTRGRKMLTK